MSRELKLENHVFNQIEELKTRLTRDPSTTRYKNWSKIFLMAGAASYDIPGVSGDFDSWKTQRAKLWRFNFLKL